MWSLAAQAVELAGAPAPPHVIELLTRGARPTARGPMTQLPLGDLRSTHDVCTELYEWATVTPLRPTTALAEASDG